MRELSIDDGFSLRGPVLQKAIEVSFSLQTNSTRSDAAFYARQQNASRVLAMARRPSVCFSVCASVCHAVRLYQNGAS